MYLAMNRFNVRKDRTKDFEGFTTLQVIDKSGETR